MVPGVVVGMTAPRCFLCTTHPHTPSTHEAFTVTHAPDPPTYFREMVPAVQSARLMVSSHPEWGVEVEVVVEGKGRVFLSWLGDGWWFVSTTGQRRAVLRGAEVMV